MEEVSKYNSEAFWQTQQLVQLKGEDGLNRGNVSFENFARKQQMLTSANDSKRKCLISHCISHPKTKLKCLSFGSTSCGSGQPCGWVGVWCRLEHCWRRLAGALLDAYLTEIQRAYSKPTVTSSRDTSTINLKPKPTPSSLPNKIKLTFPHLEDLCDDPFSRSLSFDFLLSTAGEADDRFPLAAGS